MTINTLPDLPSALIRAALLDLRACEADPLYSIYMYDWHTPRMNVCYVCLAGAVMAKSLQADVGVHTLPCNYGPDLNDKLNALNELRVGDVSLAMDTLEIYPYAVRDREITEYIDNPIGFHAEMNALADDLQKEGL